MFRGLVVNTPIQCIGCQIECCYYLGYYYYYYYFTVDLDGS